MGYPTPYRSPNIVEDQSPQLGGNLDPNGYGIAEQAIVAAGSDRNGATEIDTAGTVIITGTGGVRLTKTVGKGLPLLLFNDTESIINVYTTGTDDVIAVGTVIYEGGYQLHALGMLIIWNLGTPAAGAGVTLYYGQYFNDLVA